LVEGAAGARGPRACCSPPWRPESAVAWAGSVPWVGAGSRLGNGRISNGIGPLAIPGRASTPCFLRHRASRVHGEFLQRCRSAISPLRETASGNSAHRPATRTITAPKSAPESLGAPKPSNWKSCFKVAW